MTRVNIMMNQSKIKSLEGGREGGREEGREGGKKEEGGWKEEGGRRKEERVIMSRGKGFTCSC